MEELIDATRSMVAKADRVEELLDFSPPVSSIFGLGVDLWSLIYVFLPTISLRIDRVSARDTLLDGIAEIA